MIHFLEISIKLHASLDEELVFSILIGNFFFSSLVNNNTIRVPLVKHEKHPTQRIIDDSYNKRFCTTLDILFHFDAPIDEIRLVILLCELSNHSLLLLILDDLLAHNCCRRVSYTRTYRCYSELCDLRYLQSCRISIKTLDFIFSFFSSIYT